MSCPPASTFSPKDILELTLNIVVGILTAAPGFGAWYEFRQHRHSRKEDLESSSRWAPPPELSSTSRVSPPDTKGVEFSPTEGMERNGDRVVNTDANTGAGPAV